jgi:hypothetical protein
MFDPREALRPLRGRTYKYPRLREELRRIRLEHIAEIPPEFGVRELFLLALQSKWLEETGQGRYRVHL